MQYTVVQVAEGFGIDERTVRHWAQKRGLPAGKRDFRGTWIFDSEDVEAWAEQNGLTFHPPVTEEAK